MITITTDLRSHFGLARDQGSRPTCLAFAASDTHAASRVIPFEELSAEFLYYSAVQRSKPPDPGDGVTLTAAGAALQNDGQPLETDWPYLAALPHPISTWKPPKGLKTFRQNISSQAMQVSVIIRLIDKNMPALLVLKISEAFYTPNSEGVVAYGKNDRDTGYHAVVAVAHGVASSEGFVLIRNSWGKEWGLAGYGWLHSAYVSARIQSVSTIP